MRKLLLHPPDRHRRNNSLKQASDCGRKADVNLSDAEFGVAVHALVGKVHIVNAHNFAAVCINDLLIKQVFSNGEPALVGMVKLQSGFVGREFHMTGRNRADLVVARHQRAILSSAEHEPRDAVRLLVGDDEHFLDPAYKIAGGIVGFCSENFRCVKHGDSLQN